MVPTEPVKQVTFGGPAEDKVVTCYKCGGRDHLAKGCITPDVLGIPCARLGCYGMKLQRKPWWLMTRSMLEVVEPYVPEECMPTFVLDNVDYDPRIW